MSSSSNCNEPRSLQQLREHYLVEKELANSLRSATREERVGLYTTVYDELFRRVPHHPQLTCKADPARQAARVSTQMRLLRRLLRPDTVFLEIGAGDCALARGVAGYVKRVYAVDVSKQITDGVVAPSNFQLVISNGCSVPLPPASATVAYSNQLMEHLHPDDAREQLRDIFSALAPGGVYLCFTPNRLTGPHDISQYFDGVATGFHLKEYTTAELARLFLETGFSSVKALIVLRSIRLTCPVSIIRCFESFLRPIPPAWRKRLPGRFPFSLLHEIRLIATK